MQFDVCFKCHHVEEIKPQIGLHSLCSHSISIMCGWSFCPQQLVAGIWSSQSRHRHSVKKLLRSSFVTSLHVGGIRNWRQTPCSSKQVQRLVSESLNVAKEPKVFTQPSATIPWCCPITIYAVYLCDAYHPRSPVVWSRAVYHDDRHGKPWWLATLDVSMKNNIGHGNVLLRCSDQNKPSVATKHNKKPTDWSGQAKCRMTRIRPKVVGAGIFGRCSNFDKCRPEVPGDVICGVAVE